MSLRKFASAITTVVIRVVIYSPGHLIPYFSQTDIARTYRVILGATKVHQIQDNVKALRLVPKLTPEIMADIEKILDNKPADAPSYGRKR